MPGALQRDPLVDQGACIRARDCGVGGEAAFISADGDLRTLPCHLPDPDSRLAGVDGFYAARLEKCK